MKKQIISVVLSVVALVGVATEVPDRNIKRKRKFTHEQLVEREQLSAQRRYGGKIRKSGSAQGKVLFINVQKKISLDMIRPAFEQIDKTVRPIWAVKETNSISLVNPKETIAGLGGNVGIVIADDPRLPSLLTAPEDGWAIVNVAALCKNADTTQSVSRVRKEVMRAFALAGGCAFMSRGAILLRPDIHSPKDLDILEEEMYGVDVMMALPRLLPYFGVIPWIETTYKKACEEGWAPVPTNQYQKAIWDKVHAMPTAPLKIKPETKKVAE